MGVEDDFTVEIDLKPLETSVLIYNRDSLHPRLKLLRDELMQEYRLLEIGLCLREDQIKNEQRTLLMRLKEYLGIVPVNLEKVYEQDPAMQKINRSIDETESQVISVARVYASNYYGRPSIEL